MSSSFGLVHYRELLEAARAGYGGASFDGYPRAEPDERFDRVVSWHNPEPSHEREPVFGAVDVAEAPYGDELLSDRDGCPHEAVASGEHVCLQLLIHPELWGYGSVGAMLAANGGQWFEYLDADALELA
jgi:hypothetical protein